VTISLEIYSFVNYIFFNNNICSHIINNNISEHKILVWVKFTNTDSYLTVKLCLQPLKIVTCFVLLLGLVLNSKTNIKC